MSNIRINNIRMFLSGVMVLACGFSLQASPPAILPQPLHVEQLDGSFKLPGFISLYADPGCYGEGRYLLQQLQEEFHLKGATWSRSRSATIRLFLDTAGFARYAAEGYFLLVNNRGVNIHAATPAGIFYGIQSLLQLARQNGPVVRQNDLLIRQHKPAIRQTGRGGNAEILIPCVRISDQPRFSWRGFLLDEARHFHGMATVKALLDEMAALKMNRFHWHLTDDQGWRIEIKKYPELTNKGSRRSGTQIRGTEELDGKPHEGYYSQQEIGEIVRYAAERHIIIIPEIEMPGHASAAIAAYPWLGTSGKWIEVPGRFGVFYDVFRVSDTRVRQFLEDVVSEVLELFPSGILHIGGDEVKFDQWKASGEINRFMQEMNIRSYADLQVWFTNSMSAYISGKGARMMGWNDIMGGKLHDYNDQDDTELNTVLSPSAIVHFWKGDPALIKEAIAKGHDVVNSFHSYTYLDYSYRSIPLEKAYRFEPVPEGIDTLNASKILGLGCQMWSEWVPDRISLHRQVFPRLAAYAEVGWTAKHNKDYNRFRQALQHTAARWKQKGISVEL